MAVTIIPHMVSGNANSAFASITITKDKKGRSVVTGRLANPKPTLISRTLNALGKLKGLFF